MLMLALILYPVSVHAQGRGDFFEREKRLTANLNQIKVHKDSHSKTGVYIPENLDDALKELDSMFPEATKKAIRSAPKEDMIVFHHGLGTWLRNNWQLWGGGRLAKYFNSVGIYHPDDISGTIFDAYWSKLNGKSEDVSAKAAYYKSYWDGLRPVVDVGIKIPATVRELSMQSPSGKTVFVRDITPLAPVTVLSICSNSDVDSPRIMQALTELRSDYKPTDVSLITVVTDSSRGAMIKVADMAAEKAITASELVENLRRSKVMQYEAHSNFVLQLRVALKLDAIIIPQTLVIDRNETIVKRLNGFNNDSKSALAKIIDEVLSGARTKI